MKPKWFVINKENNLAGYGLTFGSAKSLLEFKRKRFPNEKWKMKYDGKLYRDKETGEIRTYFGWTHKSVDGKRFNAVDDGLAIEVEIGDDGDWVEIKDETKNNIIQE